MKEVWKDIPEFEGMYQVSNLGRVKSLDRTIREKNGKVRSIKGRILKQGLSSNDYLTVSLCSKSSCISYTVHKLVAMAFLNHKPNGYKELIVDHIDNNPLNNRLENLQLITQRENTSKDRKWCSSRYVGVHWDKYYKKWKASIQIKGKYKHLGYFTSELEASEAYQKALKEIQCS